MKGTTNASNTNIGGTVGSDTKPIKIVNGVATPVANDLAKASDVSTSYSIPVSGVEVFRFGRVVTVSLIGKSLAQGSEITILSSGTLPTHTGSNIHVPIFDLNGAYKGILFVNPDGRLAVNTIASTQVWVSMTYVAV